MILSQKQPEYSPEWMGKSSKNTLKILFCSSCAQPVLVIGWDKENMEIKKLGVFITKLRNNHLLGSCEIDGCGAEAGYIGYGFKYKLQLELK